MRRFLVLAFIAVLATAAIVRQKAPTLDLARFDLVDLTHSFDARTLYWPTSPTSFKLDTLAYGPTPGGWFYAANAYSAPEHGGTHLDAPIHFAAGKNTADQVPLSRLIAPAVVIDVAPRAKDDADYRLTLEDLAAFEKRYGEIRPGSIVLLETGWSSRWPDRKAYFGDDTKGDATHLHFPSFGAEVAKVLVEERRVAAIGVDTPSIDHGPSTDFPVHRVAAAANVPGFENLASLDRLPPKGAFVFALPMKIGGGSGGPLRAVALVPKQPSDSGERSTVPPPSPPR
jgi:kynurenine formamidase